MTADTNESVTVIGLGPMGQAMVRTLMAGGHPVTVWNRTPSRADDVVAEGATRAATPTDAVAASGLVLLSLTDYQAMYDILDGVGPDVLRGKVIVNLSSDTPQRSREASAWAEQHGARFVTGGVMAPPPMVGTGDAYVYYSGPAAVVEAHRHTLQLIGEMRYFGEDPGVAQLLYQAQLDVFLTILSALLHATALADSAGISPAAFLPEVVPGIAAIPVMLGDLSEMARDLESSTHPGDLNTATMMGASAEHILLASEAAGIDLELPRAIKSHYDRAIAAGHGKDGWTSLFEVIKAARV